MKLLNIALVIGLVSADATTPVYLRSDAVVEDKPDDVLASKECKDFVKEAYKETKKIMKDFENNEQALIDHVCDPVTLELAADLSDKAREAMFTETNPCAKSMQKRFADAADTIEEYTVSPDACSEGVKVDLIEYAATGNVTDLKIEPLLFPSDKNLKKDINFVGMSAWGIPTYTFKYREGTKNFSGGALDTESTYFGAMAQDLLELAPEAVTKSKVNGYYAVDYSKIDVDFYKIA